jgi:hypothetical protein
MAVGYQRMRMRFTSPPDYENENFRVEGGHLFQTLGGRVVSILPQGVRNHRWPGFLVDMPFNSGMSGGPVIDMSGAVRGIVSADMSEALEDGSRGSGTQAFATMLWLAMVIETQITLCGADGSPLTPENARLLDFVRCGVVDDHGQAHDHVRVHKTTHGEDYYYL